MYPERTAVLMCPLAPFKAFEAMDQEGSPRLMHAETHADIFTVLVKVLISLIHLTLLYCLLNIGFLYSDAKLIERVF